MLPENFVYVGLFITFLGGVSYLIKTLKGEVHPNRVTWFLWALAPLIAFAAQIKEGVGPQAWLTFIIGFQPLLIVLATFVNKKSYWKLSRLDMTFGAFSVIGLILWQITGVGIIAILFSLIADAMAGIPTIIKSYHKPETESAIAYFTTVIGSIITLLTIKEWNFATYSFPVYLFITCLILTILIHFKIGKRTSER